MHRLPKMGEMEATVFLHAFFVFGAILHRELMGKAIDTYRKVAIDYSWTRRIQTWLVIYVSLQHVCSTIL